MSRSDDGRVVQFGLVRFDLGVVLPEVRAEILSERTPLGRILINYNVLRHIDLGAILQMTIGPGLARGCSLVPSERLLTAAWRRFSAIASPPWICWKWRHLKGQGCSAFEYHKNARRKRTRLN